MQSKKFSPGLAKWPTGKNLNLTPARSEYGMLDDATLIVEHKLIPAVEETYLII